MTTPPANKHFLFPGTLYAAQQEYQITTVLGSCVAVCLWDKISGGGGMNHFMLPFWNGEGLATPKYGSIAMERLLERVLGFGCRREHLVAKVFGGANINNTANEAFLIGDRNATLALQVLQDWNIPVTASDVGGRTGRKIIMNTQTGVVLVSKGRSRP
ncbi:MAG: chemotaxis protein CheD [Geobacter sp.]